MNFVVFNNQLFDSTKINLTNKNRGFLYGDGFFESIKIFNQSPFNFNNHYNRIELSAVFLGLEFSLSKQELLIKLTELIHSNKLVNGSIRITIFRDSDGKYYPNSNESSYIITSLNDQNSSFQKNSSLSLGIYNDNLKSKSKLSNIKSLNSLLYVLASKYAKINGFDDVLLLNSCNNIVESTNSNLFLKANDVVYTPPLSEGCVDGSMRKILIPIIEKEYKLTYKSLQIKDLLESDEVILSNAISGVKKVTLFKEREYNDESLYNYLLKSINNLI